jgi:hypothetical protein
LKPNLKDINSMKMKRYLRLSPIFIATALLASCASYSASPLYNLSSDLVQSPSSTKESVLIVAKRFTKGDCDRFLDRNVIAEGYQPVQLYIQNDSDKNYIFSLNRISLPTARPEEVAEKVHTSTAGRAAGYGAGALILWPLAIPAIVDGIKSSQANDALDNDFIAKAARDQILYPHSRQNMILFVPTHSYQHSFTLTLIDQESNQPKTFNLVSR